MKKLLSFLMLMVVASWSTPLPVQASEQSEKVYYLQKADECERQATLLLQSAQQHER